MTLLKTIFMGIVLIFNACSLIAMQPEQKIAAATENDITKKYNETATKKLKSALGINKTDVSLLKLAKEAIDEQADVNFIVDEYNGGTPIFLAIDSEDESYGLELAKILIHAGADINKQDNSGQTPLMRAVQDLSYEKVKLLLEHGARTDIKNKVGQTAFDIKRERMRHKSAAQADKEKKIRDLLNSYGQPSEIKAAILNQTQMPQGVVSIVTSYLFEEAPKKPNSALQ